MLMSTGYAQTLSLKTYGISPRDVVKDSVAKYFDRAYNGLENVGNQTKVFLEVTGSAKLTAPVWSFTEKPYGSVVAFGTTRDMDTSNQVISFIPDKVGTYKIKVMDGTLSATITINSALYVGIETGACNWCHNGGTIVSPDPIYSKWTKTGHAMIFKEGLEGVASDHYSASCISCHTTGYDANAVNDGFDDRTFSFPTVLQVGMYDSMKTVYPEAMQLGNIQCESCHGPGGSHYSATDDNKMVKTLSSDNCAWCHDSGSHHYLPESADASVHANPTTLSRGSSASCAPCHSGSGFVAWIKNGKQDLTSAPAIAPIACAVCHDPHDVTNPNQLRTVTATFMNGVKVSTGQKGALCMNCHQARREAVSYTNDYLNNLSSHYGPHHGAQGDMLAGTNGITFGLSYSTSPHLSATKDACVDCHMAPVTVPSSGIIPKVGAHSFNMVDPDTKADNVSACTPCHGTFGTKFSEKKFYVNGNADLDGDGTAKGLQDEMEGLLHKLALLLPPKGSTDVSVTDSSYTLVEAQAAWNYFFVEEDRSLGVHNPAYAYSLIASAIQKLDPTTDIKLIDNTVPTSYAIDQNYPNPFNPTTTIKYTIPQESNVKLEIYDITGKLVNTIVNQSQSAGSYSVTWDGSNSSGMKVGSGMYLYRINAGSFIAVKKMILLK